MFYYCFVLLSIFNLVRAELDISLFNSSTFLGKNLLSNGEIVGLTDFNNDRFTDIFYVANEGSQLKVLLLLENRFEYEERLLVQVGSSLTQGGYKIRSIILSNFASTSLLDLVILLSKEKNGPYDAYYCYDIKNLIQPITFSSSNLFATFLQQPLVLYYKNKNVPVLLGFSSTNNKWKIWESKNSKLVEAEFTATIEISNEENESTDESDGKSTDESDEESNNKKRPLYSLYFDFDGDYFAEVMLTDYNDKSFKFYKGIAQSPFIDFTKLHKTIEFPEDAKELAQPVVADWLRNDCLGLLLAYCTKTTCSDESPKLVVYNLENSNEWMEVSVQGDFKLTTNNANSAVATRPLIASMRTVDLNLDGYPDVVTTSLDDNDKSVIGVLINLCNPNKLEFKAQLFAGKYASEVIPFDFMEDGVPDLLVNHENVIEMYKTNIDEGNYENMKFLKVSVVSSLCDTTACNEPSASPDYESITYDSPMSGSSFSLTANDASGNELSMRGHVISSTSYLALQLPFHLFGLSNDTVKLQFVEITTATSWPTVGKISTIDFQTHLIISLSFSTDQGIWLFVTRQITSGASSVIYVILIVVGVLAAIFLIWLLLRYTLLNLKYL